VVAPLSTPPRSPLPLRLPPPLLLHALTQRSFTRGKDGLLNYGSRGTLHGTPDVDRTRRALRYDRRTSGEKVHPPRDIYRVSATLEEVRKLRGQLRALLERYCPVHFVHFPHFGTEGCTCTCTFLAF